MRVYKNDSYESRGSSWQPPHDDSSFFAQNPYCDPDFAPYNGGSGNSSYDCRSNGRCPSSQFPKNWPCMQPFCYSYPVPQPFPYKFPVPCSDGDNGGCSSCRSSSEAFGYFASVTSGGTLTSGVIPFTSSGSLNRCVALNSSASTQVVPQTSGIYRAVYSVTTTAAATGVYLRLLRNSLLVQLSPIPIQEGVNVNEIFICVSRNDTLSLDISGTITLANGKNASLLLELISRK